MPWKSGACCFSWNILQSAAWAAVTNTKTATTARIATRPYGACNGDKRTRPLGSADTGAIPKIIQPRDLTTGMTQWRFKGVPFQPVDIRGVPTPKLAILPERPGMRLALERRRRAPGLR